MEKKHFKYFRLAAILLALCLSAPFIVTLAALAASDGEEEEVSKWEVLKAAYEKSPYDSVEKRIYAEGPDTTEESEKKGKIRSMVEVFVSPYDKNVQGYAQYIDLSTGELICLKLVDRDGNGEYDRLSSYEAKPIFTLEGKETFIMDYCGYWSTNPYSIGAIKAEAATKAQLYSQIKIAYTENAQEKVYHSFMDCAVNNQINVSSIRGGTRVDYTIGKEAVKYLVPRFIRTDKFDVLKEKVRLGLLDVYDDPEDAKFYYEKFLEPYYAVTKDTLNASDADYIKNSVEAFGSVTQCNPKIASKKLLLLEEYIKKYTDYSYEQLDEDHGETNYVATDKAPAVFKLALEYTVDEDGLLVRCSAGNLRFDSSSFKLSDVFLLPYAGAGNTSNKGYALYPDGSGTIIDFESARGKTFNPRINAYGQDYAYSTISGANNEVARLPVFGMVENETAPDGAVLTRGFLAYIEEGDSLAKIIVESSGGVHLYLQAYTAFNPRPKDSYSLSGGISTGANAMWTVESKRKYTKNYKIRIFILDETESTYSSMAKMLREYLIKKGDITPMEDDGKKDVPLVLETLGAIESTKRILGVPVATMRALTTFSDIQTQIIDRLQDSETLEGKTVDNLAIKMTGWSKGGMAPDVPAGIKAEDCLGGNSGFKALTKYCKEKDVALFPDFDFAYSHNRGSLFGDFSENKDLSRTIDDKKAFKKEWDPIFQSYAYSGLGVISPNRMMRFYDKTYSKYKDYGVGGISAGTLGEDINSDFNEKNPLNREDAKVLQNRLLAKIKEQNEKVMLSGGNIFTVKYADYLLNIPLEDSKLKCATAEIPFLSMVLHGCVEYSGTALNLAGDYQNFVLKTIESGANPYFIIALQNTSELKNKHPEFYSVRYSIWLKDIYNTYHTINGALKDVRYSQIVSHEFIDRDNRVVRVKYANGVSFVINYLLEDYTYYDNGTVRTVPREGFLKFNADGGQTEVRI